MGDVALFSIGEVQFGTTAPGGAGLTQPIYGVITLV